MARKPEPPADMPVSGWTQLLPHRRAERSIGGPFTAIDHGSKRVEAAGIGSLYPHCYKVVEPSGPGFYLPFLVAHTAELQASAACSSGYPSGINNTPALQQQMAMDWRTYS